MLIYFIILFHFLSSIGCYVRKMGFKMYQTYKDYDVPRRFLEKKTKEEFGFRMEREPSLHWGVKTGWQLFGDATSTSNNCHDKLIFWDALSDDNITVRFQTTFRVLGDAKSDSDGYSLQSPATLSGRNDWLVVSLLCKMSQKNKVGPENEQSESSGPSEKFPVSQCSKKKKARKKNNWYLFK